MSKEDVSAAATAEQPEVKRRIGGRRLGGMYDMTAIRAIVEAKRKAKADAIAAGKSEAEIKAAIAAVAHPNLQAEDENESKSESKSKTVLPTTRPTTATTVAATTAPDTGKKKSIDARSVESRTSAVTNDTGRTISDVADNQRREDIPITGQTLLGEGNALSDQTCPHRHVKLKMTYKERVAYQPPRGINVLFYGPRDDELKLPEGEVYATFYCPVLNPNRDEQKYIDDIDEELARLNRVIQDNITEWHEPKLVKHPKVMIHALIEKLHDNPDLEPHIKNIRDITKTDVTQSAIDEMNAKENIQKYEKLKQSLLKKTDRKTADGDKISEGTTGVL